MADNSTSTPVAAAPTNTPAPPFASGDGGAGAGSGAAGAAASGTEAAPAKAEIVQPRATGVKSLRPTVGRPAPLPAREAAPASDPKGEAAVSKVAPTEPGSAAGTDKPAEKPKEPGSRADDPKLGKSWADLMDREASHTEREKTLKQLQAETTEAQRQITAEKKAMAEEKAQLALLKTPGKRIAILKQLGIEMSALSKEYLEDGDAQLDPVVAAERAAERKFKEMEEAHQAEIKKLAEERNKELTDKAMAELNQTYKALETEFVANAASYSTIKAFGLSKEQVLQCAASELGRLPGPAEGKAGMDAAQAYFHKKILAAGYVLKSDVPAPAPAPAAAAEPEPAPTSAASLSSSRQSVPLTRRPNPTQTWQERLAEGKRLLNIAD